MRSASLREARFRERRNRFLAVVEMDGDAVLCHLPNPGRLRELLRPGARVYLTRREGSGRKTAYDLVAVEGEVLVSIDSRLPNVAVRELLQEGRLWEFSGYREVSSEIAVGEGRLDFLLRNGQDCYLEVKSCTLVVEGVALFPDAPTERGTRHLKELSQLAAGGQRSAVMFVVQRPDATLFKPNDATDPKFGKALRGAHRRGVEVYAYRCRFDGRNLVDFKPIQTSLGGG